MICIKKLSVKEINSSQPSNTSNDNERQEDSNQDQDKKCFQEKLKTYSTIGKRKGSSKAYESTKSAASVPGTGGHTGARHHISSPPADSPLIESWLGMKIERDLPRKMRRGPRKVGCLATVTR